MINTELIKNSVALMGGFEAEEIEKFSPVISAAASGAEAMLKEDADRNDPRVIQLAAAIAYKALCCTAEKAENITSFTAGDVTVKQESDLLAGAEAYYSLAAESCRDLFRPEEEKKPDDGNTPDEEKPEPVKNDGFAFLGV